MALQLIGDYIPIDKALRETGRMAPKVHVVDPCGEVRMVTLLEPRGGIAAVEGGRPEVSPRYARQGWILLSDAYAQDSDPRRRSEGYTTYRQWDRAGRSGRVQPLADAWLPDLVRERRAEAARKAQHGVWEAPPAPSTEDAMAEVFASVSEKGKRK